MSSAPVAKKLDVDPVDAAFDTAPLWEECPEDAKEEIAERMREVRQREADGTLGWVQGVVVTTELAERVARAKRGE